MSFFLVNKNPSFNWGFLYLINMKKTHPKSLTFNANIQQNDWLINPMIFKSYRSGVIICYRCEVVQTLSVSSKIRNSK